ncbi:hypothetical protein [Methylobacterium planeticum]|uniref:PQQ-binding-like beta-propeller repeat protein n=1 Tax=Methylobacterium planeticum TaxID=2615211 RepID=A0A6N6MWM0_9HYPH|nr:hypothetical protein [Methylobacterium planeticum]KAB1073429.1 hypothetical protein F6X51_11845 [Methylobacterium planeticum]
MATPERSSAAPLVKAALSSSQRVSPPSRAAGIIWQWSSGYSGASLDAKTGKVNWSVVNGDPKKGETNTATVLPVKDKAASSSSPRSSIRW